MAANFNGFFNRTKVLVIIVIFRSRNKVKFTIVSKIQLFLPRRSSKNVFENIFLHRNSNLFFYCNEKKLIFSNVCVLGPHSREASYRKSPANLC